MKKPTYLSRKAGADEIRESQLNEFAFLREL